LAELLLYLDRNRKVFLDHKRTDQPYQGLMESFKFMNINVLMTHVTGLSLLLIGCNNPQPSKEFIAVCSKSIGSENKQHVYFYRHGDLYEVECGQNESYKVYSRN
jgi:hypothetical protein